MRHLPRRRAGRALECPASNVADLFLHGARERNDADGYPHEILIRYLAVFQPRLGQGGHHALLDLGTGPAHRELRQLSEIETGGIHATPREMDLEDFDSLVVERQVHEE